MTTTLSFEAIDPADNGLVGGKAAGLARLVAAGFPVPPGFVITTQAYEQFLEAAGLLPRFSAILAAVDYSQAPDVEAKAREIREIIEAAPVPESVLGEIRVAYGALGDCSAVAVRSSGTAEDTAEASFAGLHDTYLDICGEEAVLDAVRRCWASMWTGRALAYRHRTGHSNDTARIAVVVQVMVASDVSGVMFTVNPVSGRTDEIVVNASWGLGEGIVSGVVVPDEYILSARTLAPTRRAVGSKEVQVVKDPDTGKGTVHVPVPEEKRGIFCLSNAQMAELGALGLRVADYHGGLPQDIEWAMRDGKFHLLQSRPVTGIELTWDEDVDAWQTVPDKDDTLWSGSWAAEFWSGGITPLFYSVRAAEMWRRNTRIMQVLGLTDLMRSRWTKYRRATAFYNVDIDERLYRSLLPRILRGGALTYHPQSMRETLARQPWEKGRFIKAMSRLYLTRPDMGLHRWERTLRKFMDETVNNRNYATREELRSWDDARVRAYAEEQVALAEDFLVYTSFGAYLHAKPIIGALSLLVRRWNPGADQFLFQDMISGLATPSLLMKESRELWHLAQVIRNDPYLLDAFQRHLGAAFFEEMGRDPKGADFIEQYRGFVGRHGHGGHADRDIYFSRRIEDPALDYESLAVLLKAVDLTPPEEFEHRLIRKREEATARAMAGIRKQRFGGLKAALVKSMHNWVMKFLVVRDDWRHSINRVTLAKKWAFREMGLRAFERGLLKSERDFYFLSRQELNDVLDGKARMPLIHAKVAARMRVFDEFLARREVPPPYLRGNLPIDLDNEQPGSDADVLRGTSISRGVVRARACIVADLAEIGTVKAGDILICNSTDPAWAPVFPVISGLILETGGMLSHGACLSREYGLPAVQLRNAMHRIPHGALLELNGQTGEISIIDEDTTEAVAA